MATDPTIATAAVNLLAHCTLMPGMPRGMVNGHWDVAVSCIDSNGSIVGQALVRVLSVRVEAGALGIESFDITVEDET